MQGPTKSSPHEHDSEPRVHSPAMPKTPLRILRAAPLLCLLMAGPFACSETMSAGFAIVPDAGVPGIFTPPDGGGDGALGEPDAGLITYCPTSACPAWAATCPGSRFPCDVDLTSDPNNCGGCGVVCPTRVGNGTFDCVDGACVMACDQRSWTRDCNGIIDDDCEVTLGTNANCNGCGDTCPDPSRPCIFDSIAGKGRCGCDGGQSFCGSSCVDTSTSDTNCGACGVRCDPTGDGGPTRPHAHYGCAGGECGRLKCDGTWADCDGDAENGCETSLLSAESCGACGKACDPGQSCIARANGQIECICPAGTTRCENNCVDIATDPFNCGGCGINCTLASVNAQGVGLCNYGSCVFSCMQGWGDCNHDPKDGCEVNLGSDPRNCGACGKVCDAVPGQPCVGGQCAVTPCDDGQEEAR